MADRFRTSRFPLPPIVFETSNMRSIDGKRRRTRRTPEEVYNEKLAHLSPMMIQMWVAAKACLVLGVARSTPGEEIIRELLDINYDMEQVAGLVDYLGEEKEKNEVAEMAKKVKREMEAKENSPILTQLLEAAKEEKKETETAATDDQTEEEDEEETEMIEDSPISSTNEREQSDSALVASQAFL